MDKKQKFDVRTATSVVNDAILGSIALQLKFVNMDESVQQCPKQSFLVLRDSFQLNVPLLGANFLTQNRAEIKFNPEFSLYLNQKNVQTEISGSMQREPCNINMLYTSITPDIRNLSSPGPSDKINHTAVNSDFPSCDKKVNSDDTNVSSRENDNNVHDLFYNATDTIDFKESGS